MVLSIILQRHITETPLDVSEHSKKSLAFWLKKPMKQRLYPQHVLASLL